MIGKTIQQYEIQRELGRGGMGTVYEALDTRLGRPVALKSLPRNAVQDRTAVERFRREAQTASALNHPGIVTIHDFVDTDEHSCIVMELVEGRTLRAWMAGGKRPGPESIGIALQVAEALSVAHGAGIVHRDLKPENIMIRDDGYAKILDFGLAKLAGHTKLTRDGATVGTVAYMSPEQARGNDVGLPTDVWALGVILYELLAGRSPFTALHEQAILYNIINTAPRPIADAEPNTTAPALETLVVRMLDKCAELRPTAGEVAAALAEADTRPGAPDPEAERAEPTPTLVGRSEHEERMARVFDSVSGGRARVLCVTGEAGIGKSTLTQDFLARLRGKDTPCFIARGRCSERLAGTEAYLPLLEALENLLRTGRGGELADTMKQFAPTWYVRIAPPGADDSSGARLLDDARAASQERMKRELFAFLRQISRGAPVVLFFDDVHWADASTVDFLAYIGMRGDGLRLLTIATYRPSELLISEHPFVGVKRELQARGICEEIALGFLGRDDVSSYLNLEFPGHAFPDALVEFVHGHTDGSPLFMVNVVRYLRGTGAIVHRNDGWHLDRPLSEIEREVPESIRSMIEHKIALLDEANRRLVTVASVQGAEFHASVVAEAMEADEADIEDMLERLDRVHAFVRRAGEEELPDGSLTLRYRFVHALYQNALYADLTPARRRRLCNAVAEALSKRYEPDLPAIAGELGILFEITRDFTRASDSFLLAAKKAIRVYANREAVQLCQRSIANARKLKDGEGERRIVAAAFELANLQMTISDFEGSAGSFEVAEHAAEAGGLAEERIRAICGKGMSVFNLKRIDEMRSAGETALKLARSIDSPGGVALAEMVLASQHLCLGELSEAEPLFGRALPELQKAGLQMQALEGVIYRGALHAWRQEYDAAHSVLAVGLNKGRELGSGFAIGGAHFFSAITLGNQGRVGEALASLTEARRLAELNQERYWLPRLPNTIAWLLRELGDAEQAHRLNLENVELGREFGMPEGEANAHVNLAIDYRVLGDLPRSHAHLEMAVAIYRDDIWYRWRYNIRLQAAYAEYWIARGDLGKAREHAAASEEAARTHEDRKYRALAGKILGDIALLEDDVERAGNCYDESLRILAAYPCPTVTWKILVARGQLAATLGNEAAAGAFRGRARAIIAALADSVTDSALKARFLKSRAVREV